MTFSHVLLLSVPILAILGMTLLPVFVIEEVLGSQKESILKGNK